MISFEVGPRAMQMKASLLSAPMLSSLALAACAVTEPNETLAPPDGGIDAGTDAGVPAIRPGATLVPENDTARSKELVVVSASGARGIICDLVELDTEPTRCPRDYNDQSSTFVALFFGSVEHASLPRDYPAVPGGICGRPDAGTPGETPGQVRAELHRPGAAPVVGTGLVRILSSHFGGTAFGEVTGSADILFDLGTEKRREKADFTATMCSIE